MATATQLIGKRVTVFGVIATATGVGKVRKDGVVNTDERICVLTDTEGVLYYVFASVIDALPETISRHSFVYRP